MGMFSPAPGVWELVPRSILRDFRPFWRSRSAAVLSTFDCSGDTNGLRGGGGGGGGGGAEGPPPKHICVDALRD